MQWQLALVAISLVLLARTAKALAAESLDARPPNRRTQLLLGLVCGGVGALVATVPFADSVGDRFGTPLIIAAAVVTVAAIVRGVARRRRTGRPVS